MAGTPTKHTEANINEINAVLKGWDLIIFCTTLATKSMIVIEEACDENEDSECNVVIVMCRNKAHHALGGGASITLSTIKYHIFHYCGAGGKLPP